MRILRLLLAVAALAALLGLLSTSLKVGEATLPPLGRFFNPFSGFWRNAEPITGPKLASKLALPGLTAPVEVAFDNNLVPHIFAQNIHDASMVQGYLTAQQRLFQMDLTARKVDGRLSEVLGERTLEVDKLTRRRGLPWAAERDLEAWKQAPGGIAPLEAYTEGVNAYIAQLKPADYPIEFKLLDYQPEPWSVYKCALVVNGMADMLAVYDRDLAATNTLERFGRADYDFLYPNWNPKQQPVIIDNGGLSDGTTSTELPRPSSSGSSPAQPGPPTGSRSRLGWNDYNSDPEPPKNGSNNWAVGGQRTASGHPLLANDPHLGLTLPSIWFQVQIHTPEVNTYGVSLPGLPGVVIGFNENVAWGITNVGVDVSDWYRIHWADASKNSYLLDGQPKRTELRVENIVVKGRETPLLDTVRYTVWGPVVYEAADQPLHDCAYRWLAHDPSVRSTIEQFAQLNASKSFDDYQRALVDFDCPAQNFVFAAKAGDIAIRVQGHHPLREGEQGRFMRDGSLSSEAWAGYLTQENVPRMHNPERGFVFSANQHSMLPTDPRYFKYGDWEQYRSRRIFERLNQMQGATVDSMKSVQLDNFSRRAADVLPTMLRLLDRQGLDPVAQGYVAELEKWNCRYDRDLTAPALFEMWYDSTFYRTWDEMDALRQQKIPILFPEAWRFIELLEQDTSNRYFDYQPTPEHETARQIVTAAFGQMCSQAAKEALGGTLVYGKFKRFTINHLARIPAFSRTDVLVGGHRSAPNAILRDHGPSWRMIVDLSGTVHGIGVYPGGQSGNPGSRFYDNLVDQWAAGEYNDLLFFKQLSDATAEQILTRQVYNP